jgi:dihydrofolate reductase
MSSNGEVGMRKLSAFVFVTLNGFYKGPDQDISWNTHAEEEKDFSVDALKSENTLLFGRVTYELMTRYWPTPMAMENDPIMAAGMNKAEKIVFSRTLKKADWNNTRLVIGDMEQEVRKLKQQPGKNLTVLGSGSIVTQLADQSLIDEYQIMLNPIALGNGTPLFLGLKQKLNLKLVNSKVFNNGIVLLTYHPGEKV